MSYYHECDQCHATLDPGERCDCQQARAVCPFFSDRVDYKGVSSIVCLSAQRARVQTEYESRSVRDAHYRIYCCDGFANCRFYGFINGIKGEGEGV